MPMFKAEIYKTQKTTLGYSAKQIIKKVANQKRLGYEKPNQFCLSVPGCFLREFELVQDNPENIVVQSGIVQYTLTK